MLKSLVTILMVVTVSLGLVLATGCKSEPIEVNGTKGKAWAEKDGEYLFDYTIDFETGSVSGYMPLDYYEGTVNITTGSVTGTMPLPDMVDPLVNNLPDITVNYENSVLTSLIIDGKTVNLLQDIKFTWHCGQLTEIFYNGKTYHKGDKLSIGENQWEITSEFNGSNVATLEIHNGKVILSDGTHEFELKGVYRVLDAPYTR